MTGTMKGGKRKKRMMHLQTFRDSLELEKNKYLGSGLRVRRSWGVFF
jgi:hypothetical protein